MPLYTYRRDDGTTFEIKQSFSDDALTVDPVTGQRVVRVVQAAGVIFKGSGFYVTDSKSASKASLNGNGSSKNGSSAAGDSKTETKSEAKTETTRAEVSPAAAD